MERSMSKHMLLIGGSREVHPKVKALGLRASLLFNMATLKNRRNMAMYERIVGLPATASVDEWIETARLLHRFDPFDCLGGFNEPTQDRAAAVAHALGLPYLTADAIAVTRQKDRMRGMLREAGLDTTASRLVDGAADVAAFGDKHGYPIVLKPVDGRGSLGISIVRSSLEIEAAVARFARWAPDHRMLAEQFLDGEEWSVEGFSEDGRHRIVCVTQKFKDPVTCVETGHCLPAPLAEDARVAIERFVASVLTAVGLTDGPSHTEVIVTRDGPRIVETHARLGGDSIVEMIQLVSGVDLDELWIRQCAGERVLDRVPTRLERFASIAFATPRAHGVLERVDGVAEAAASPGVVRVELLEDPGAEMHGAQSSETRGGFVIATGDTAAEATAHAHAARGRLRFVVACPACPG
jgi:biotin carboxylase